MYVKTFAAAISCIALAACASTERYPRAAKLSANPSALVAQEIAFARLAAEKGQWTAFRELAGPDAVMFAPEPVNAQNWLKNKADSVAAVKWQVHNVFMSCDGKTGVTKGAWQSPEGKYGYFMTVWQRYENKRGEGKWLFSFNDSVPNDKSLKAPDFIGSKTASCKGKAPAIVTAPPEGVLIKQSFAYDQSLSWTYVYRNDASRDVRVNMWDGEKMAEIDSYSVPAR
jgi:hypothetical protein